MNETSVAHYLFVDLLRTKVDVCKNRHHKYAAVITQSWTKYVYHLLLYYANGYIIRLPLQLITIFYPVLSIDQHHHSNVCTPHSMTKLLER